jgi:hypothetical protein
LITGLLLCLPTAVLLASVSLTVLAGQLRRLMKSQSSDPPTIGPSRSELGDRVTPAPTPVGRLRTCLYEAPLRGPRCQTPMAFPAGSRVIATHRSPSGYGLVVTSPP